MCTHVYPTNTVYPVYPYISCVLMFTLAILYTLYIENTSWKVLAYGIYARVVDVSEIEGVSAANE